MSDIAAIEAEIASLQQQLQQTKGTPTEVYTRIVGYYRSVNNWNKGKREEYNQRRQFVLNGTMDRADSRRDNPTDGEQSSSSAQYTEVPTSYLYFYRNHCAPCVPMGKVVDPLPFQGEKIDVDTPEGTEKAGEYNVMSTPTVLFFDQANKEISRVHDARVVEQYIPEALAYQM